MSKYLQLASIYPDQPYGNDPIINPLSKELEPIIVPKDTATPDDLKQLRI